MRRRFIWGLLVCLLATPAFGGEFDLAPPRAPPPSTPWYLPRGVFFGTFVGKSVTPQLRVNWELVLLQERLDALMLVFEGGVGWAASTATEPDELGHPGIGSLYQQSLQLGLGYRETSSSGFDWGFQITIGAGFFGATSPGLPADHRILPIVEGRIQAGWKVGHFELGASGGVQQLLREPPGSYVAPRAGGLLLGMYLEWR